MKRRRSVPPAPPPSPPGYVWLYWNLVPEEVAERHAKKLMAGFDNLPPIVRFALNETTTYTGSNGEAKRLVERLGPVGAALHIMGKGARP